MEDFKQLEYKDLDKNKVDATLYSIISNILKKEFGAYSQRSQIVKFKDRYNFSCPYCGDSVKNQSKKRGNFYLGSLGYHCFNCGVHKTLKNIIYDFKGIVELDETLSVLIQHSITEIGKVSDRTTFYDTNIDLLFSTNINPYLFTVEEISNAYNAKPVYDYPIYSYLEKRLQFKYDRFLWNSKRQQLFILNMHEKFNKVVGFQIRNMDTVNSYGNKYLTYDYTKIIQDLDKDIEIEDSNILNKLSMTYNIFNVDWSAPITVFEGPLDSMLFKNAVALSTVGTDAPFQSSNFRYLFDYDTAGKNKMFSLLQYGNKVFKWKQFLTDFNIQISKKKIDWSDVMIYCYKNSIRLGNLDSYFTNDKFDIIHIL